MQFKLRHIAPALLALLIAGPVWADDDELEITMEVIGSAFSPGPQRLEAAIKRGTPMIVSHGILEVVSWPPYFPLKDNLADRPHLEHNDLLWMLFTTREERLAAAKILFYKFRKVEKTR